MTTSASNVPDTAQRDLELRILAELFGAFSDPARLRILNLIAHAGEVCGADLEAITGYGASKVSRHLALLKRAGLIQDRRQGVWVFHALRPSPGIARAALDRLLANLPDYYAVLAADGARLHPMSASGGDPTRRAVPLQEPLSSSTPMHALKHSLGTKQRVLFLCQSNAARSQMAEAFLRTYGGDRFEAHSAGLTAGALHPLTRQVMAEVGLDLAGQAAKGVNEYLGKKTFAFVITLCLEAEEECPRMFPGAGKILQWPFEDVANAQLPDAEKLQKFRTIRDRIELKVKEWLRD